MTTRLGPRVMVIVVAVAWLSSVALFIPGISGTFKRENEHYACSPYETSYPPVTEDMLK